MIAFKMVATSLYCQCRVLRAAVNDNPYAAAEIVLVAGTLYTANQPAGTHSTAAEAEWAAAVAADTPGGAVAVLPGIAWLQLAQCDL